MSVVRKNEMTKINVPLVKTILYEAIFVIAGYLGLSTILFRVPFMEQVCFFGFVEREYPPEKVSLYNRMVITNDIAGALILY